MSENQFWYLAYLRAKALWSREEFITYQREIMQQVKNSLNAQSFPKQGEVFTLPSMTVPDQTLTVRELMLRYAQGLPLEGERVPIWDGEDESMPDLRRMDLSEIEDYRNAVKSEMAEIRDRLTERMKKAATEKEIVDLQKELARLKVSDKIQESQKEDSEAKQEDADPKK